VKKPNDSTDDVEESSEDDLGNRRWDNQPGEIVITKRASDDDTPRSKFEWRPEDVVILEPGDPEYHDEDE
jgi:hypothetical protein